MKKLIVKLHTGYRYMDQYDILVMPDDATEEEISEEVNQMALDHAEMYGIYPYPEDFDEDDDEEWYSDNIHGYVIGEYVPEKHDMYRSGGGLVDLSRMISQSMMYKLEDLVEGNVYFVEYRNGNLWYEAGRHLAEKPFLFPVPVTEAVGRRFRSCDSAILYEPFIADRLESNIYYGDYRDKL